MLTGVDFDEIIKRMKGCGAKWCIKETLDYYGIKYKTTAKRFDSSVTFPDLCLLSLTIASNAANNNGGEYDFEKGIGHWSLYFKGKFYDPDWGICDECPPQLKINMVWEIYP